jgi:hypothetical protein
MSGFSKFIAVAGVGLTAWMGGMYSERYIIKEKIHKPGLPIFSTVSAATPIESVPRSANRVSEVRRSTNCSEFNLTNWSYV